jgi:hypothetical protein
MGHMAASPLLTPLKPSRYRHEKESVDGVWHFARVEQPGTPWVVTHVPTDRWLYLPNLRAARALTASGWVQAELDRQVVAA